MLVERLAHLGEGARLEPRLEQRGDAVTGTVPVFLLAEIGAERSLHRREVLLDPGGAHERVPLVEADRDHHHTPSVARGEVAAERAVHVVAQGRTVLVAHLCLCEESEVGDHGERDVGERQLHQLALTRGAAVALGGEDADHRVEPGGDVPRGERVVHREE